MIFCHKSNLHLKCCISALPRKCIKTWQLKGCKYVGEWFFPLSHSVETADPFLAEVIP